MQGIGLHSIRFFSSLSHVACVSVICNEHGTHDYTCVCFERNKQEFSQTHVSYSGQSVQELCSHIPSRYPIILHVDGKGIISRYISGEFETEQDVALQFPDFNDSSFVRSVTLLPHGAIFSVARTQIIDAITQQLPAHAIIHIELGAGVFAYSISLFTNQSDIAQIPLWNIMVQNQTCVGIERKDAFVQSDVRIGSEQVKTNELYAYCIAVQCFQPHFLNTRTDNYFDTTKMNFAYIRKSKQLAIVAIGILLIVLAVNAVLFSSYYTQQQDLQFQVSQHNTTLRTLQTMQLEYEQKKALVSHVNVYKSGGYPYFFDRIGTVLPRDIVLQKMWCNPLHKDIKQDKEIEFTTDCIMIYGIAPQITSLYTWVDLLKRESWIQSVELVDYSNSAQQSNSQFILKILL